MTELSPIKKNVKPEESFAAQNEQIKKAIYQQAFIQAPKANAEYVRKVRNIFRPQRL